MLRALVVWALLLGSSLGLLSLASIARLKSRALLPVCWIVGPSVWIALTLPFRFLGMGLRGSSLIALLPFAVSILFFLLAGQPRMGSHDLRHRIDLRPAREAASSGTTLAFLISLSLLGLFFLNQGSATSLWDSQYHARLATYLQIAPLPPSNPFLAGRPLPYPWFYDLKVAALSTLSGLSPYRVFPVLDLHSIGALVLAVSLCLPATRRSRRNSLPLLLAIWAPNALGWLFLVGRWLTGTAVGFGAAREAAGNFNIVLSQMAPHFTRALAFPAHKFLEGTPFTESLGLTFLTIGLSGRIFRQFILVRSVPGSPGDKNPYHGPTPRPSWLDSSLLVLVLATWFHVHFMGALLFIPAMAFVILCAALMHLPREGKRLPGAVALLGGCAAAALLVSLPYLRSTVEPILGAGGARLIGFGPRTDNLIALAALGTPYILIGLLGAGVNRGLSGKRPTEESWITLGWIAGCFCVMSIFGLSLALTDHNEEKILVPAAMLVPLMIWPWMERALLRGWRRALTWLFIGASAFGILFVILLAGNWHPANQYRDDDAVAKILDRYVSSDAVVVSDAYAPLPQTRAGFLYFPELQGMWGFVRDLREREGVIEALKGSPLRLPLGLPPVREGGWPKPEPCSTEAAIARLGRFKNGAVVVAPKGEWTPLLEARGPESGIEQLPSPMGWDIFLVAPSASGRRSGSKPSSDFSLQFPAG